MDNETSQPRRSSRRRSRPEWWSDSPSPVPAKRRRTSSHTTLSTASASRTSNVAKPGQPSAAPKLPVPREDSDQDRIEASDPSIFRFMDLPAELRVHVYRMALLREQPLYLHLPQKSNAGTDDEENCVPVRTRSLRAGIACRHLSNRSRYPRHDYFGESVQRPKDDINPALLRTCSLVYKEARQVLYSDNQFILNLDTGIHSLESLRQRNRSLIKAVALTIPSHHDILDGFADVVRLGLRYCWGLKSLTITLPDSFPDDRHLAGTTNVYANAFHILRWLPKGCRVKIEGSVSETIRKVVSDEGRLMDVLDDREYLKRQHQMPERH